MGDNQRYENLNFYGTGCRATDSSIIHPGNIGNNAHHVEIVNCKAFSGNPETGRYNRTTFYDAQASDVLVKGCEVRGGKKGFILALGKSRNSNISIIDCKISVRHHCLHVYPSRNTETHQELSNILRSRIQTTRGPGREWLKGSFVQNILIKQTTICRRLGNCTTLKEQRLSAPNGSIR